MWDKITVKQYYDIISILDDDPVVVNESLIKLLFNKEMGDLPLIELQYYLNELKFLQEDCPDVKLQKSYTIKDMVFKPMLDLRKLTTAQFIDYQEFTKRNDHKHILNCLLIKDGEKYGDNDYSDLL